MKIGTAYQSYAQNYQKSQTSHSNMDTQTNQEKKFEIPKMEEKRETKNSQMDAAVVDFLKDLREKGAAKFLADLNQEKIDKLVQEYEQKLIENMGDSPEDMQSIAKLVEDFKKKLIEDMREKMEDEIKIAKGRLNSNQFTSIELTSQKKATPLEELLKL